MVSGLEVVYKKEGGREANRREVDLSHVIILGTARSLCLVPA